MKHCPECDATKSLDEFSVRSKSKDGRQPWCKACSTSSFKSYYKDNPQSYRSRAKKVYQEADATLRELKTNKACMDCKVAHPYYVLQFDHRDPSVKLGNVGDLRGHGKQKVLDEVQKCDLVCSNCHAERTHRRGHTS